MIFNLLALTDQIFGEPYPAARVYDDADADTMQRGTRQVDAMPAGRRLIPHALLYGIDTAPGVRIGTSQSNVFAAVGIARETLVRDAHTLVFAVGTGVAEAAVNHIPAMQARPARQRVVPHERIEADGGAILVDEREKLLS